MTERLLTIEEKGNEIIEMCKEHGIYIVSFDSKISEDIVIYMWIWYKMKTIKEIEYIIDYTVVDFDGYDNPNREDINVVITKELKQTAIEDIREYRISQRMTKDTITISKFEHVIDYIRNKFNITEKDLK